MHGLPGFQVFFSQSFIICHLSFFDALDSATRLTPQTWHDFSKHLLCFTYSINASKQLPFDCKVSAVCTATTAEKRTKHLLTPKPALSLLHAHASHKSSLSPNSTIRVAIKPRFPSWVTPKKASSSLLQLNKFCLPAAEANCGNHTLLENALPTSQKGKTGEKSACSCDASWVGTHGSYGIPNSSRAGATALGQVHYNRCPFLVSPSDVDYSRPDEPHKVLLWRRCRGLKLPSSSLAPGTVYIISRWLTSPGGIRQRPSSRSCSMHRHLPYTHTEFTLSFVFNDNFPGSWSKTALSPPLL